MKLTPFGPLTPRARRAALALGVLASLAPFPSPMPGLVAGLAALAAAGAVAPALADAPGTSADIAALAGDWRGEGRVATRPDGPLEPARCRIEAQYVAEEASLVIRGRCAVAAGARPFTMKIVDDGAGRMRAGMHSPTMEETAQFRGGENGGGIELASRAPLKVKDDLYHARIEMVPAEAGDSFALRQWLRPVPAGSDGAEGADEAGQGGGGSGEATAAAGPAEQAADVDGADNGAAGRLTVDLVFRRTASSGG